GPGHRLVVVVYPRQDVRVALVGMEDHGPVLLVYAHGPHFVVPDIMDFLVVNGRRLWIGFELLRKLTHLLLLRTRNSSVCVQKVATKGDGRHSYTVRASKILC